MDINKESLSSPASISFAYLCAASLCILVFRLIFPGEDPPLPIFIRDWRLIRGMLDIIALFPALAFSALVLPYGIASAENYRRGFSEHLFQRMVPSIVTAIVATGLYALLFFLALPLAQNYEANLRYQGEIYHLAKERAQIHKDAREWSEASQFLGLCESIWENSPEIAALRGDINTYLEGSLFERQHWAPEETSPRGPNSASVSAIPGQGQPLSASDAIAQGETALNEGRMFDAHWLATVAGRLAREGSPEVTAAARLAARAWNQIESQQPTRAQREAFELYRLKRDGYTAMREGEWIRAYYIFQELLTKTPKDPDAENYFKLSEKGTKEVAFFFDEMEISLGETLTGIIFSLPHNTARERSVMRVESFSTHPDFAYGTGLEFMAFDAQSRLQLSLKAPYAKILPITLDGQPQVLIMMRSLDRHDRNKRWEPTWESPNSTTYRPETAQIVLNISYETFLMLSEMRQRLPSLDINALFAASDIAGGTGYIPEVFQAEILNRLGSCLFFLPMAVIVLIIGWNYRAKRQSRFFFALSIPVLPLIFNGLTYLYRTILNAAGISLLVNYGFSTALTAFIVILSLSFVLSLIALAAQHD
jgi:hypothetical protein